MYDLDEVRVEQIAIAGAVVMIEAVPTAGESSCPACGQPSARIHSRYVRALRDLPCGGRQVRVRLTVRRFRCGAPACARHTFVEQVPGVTRRDVPAIVAGDTVLHERWGEGVVVTTRGGGEDMEATIRFEDVGEQRVLLASAPLTKMG